MNEFCKAIVDALEFDTVIEVFEDQTFIVRNDLFSPDLLDDEIQSNRWRFWSYGYTNQYGYNGPMLHDSETWSMSMVRDLIESPGIYTCVYGMYTNDDPEFSDIEPTIIEGWAVLEYSDTPIVAPIETEHDSTDVFDTNDIDTAELPDTPEHN